MEYSLFIKLAAEFVGTAVLMVFGNGAVANAELKNTKGYHAGWLNIAMGYGFGVMFPVLMFGGVSGAHINPAMTLAQAINGMFPWGQVLPYIIAQLLGAVVGQLIVYITTGRITRILKMPTPFSAPSAPPMLTTTASTTSSTSSSAPSCWCLAHCAASKCRGVRKITPPQPSWSVSSCGAL